MSFGLIGLRNFSCREWVWTISKSFRLYSSMSSKLHNVMSCCEYCFGVVKQYLHPPALLSLLLVYKSEINVSILIVSPLH